MPALEPETRREAQKTKTSIFNGDRLKARFNDCGINPAHVQTLLRHVIKGQTDFSKVPNLPVKAVALLNEEFCITQTKVVSLNTQGDGSTTKLLVELPSGQRYPLKQLS